MIQTLRVPLYGGLLTFNFILIEKKNNQAFVTGLFSVFFKDI